VQNVRYHWIEPASRRGRQGLGCTSNVDERAAKSGDGLILEAVETDRDPRLALSPKESVVRDLPDRHLR